MPVRKWIRMRLRRLAPVVVALALLGGGTVVLSVVSAAPALADTGGYPYWGAPCEFGSAGGTSCMNPNNQYDLYDWFESSNGQFSGNGCGTSSPSSECFDQWGYEYRNCTSFVAWKISQEFNGRDISGWGNAADWATAAQNAGYSLDSSPQAGDIAVWGSEVGDGFGHVAYVASVSNGVATFDEYNVAGTGAYTDSYTSTDHPGGQVHPNWYIHMGTPADGGGGSPPPPPPPPPSYIVVLEGSTMEAKQFLGDPWTELTDGAATDIQSAGNQFAYLTSTGELYVKDGLNGSWYDEAGGVSLRDSAVSR